MDQESALILALQAGLHQCGAAMGDHGGLLASLFVMGLLGGIGHCAGMCGPFVLTQVSARLQDCPARGMTELTRLKGALLAPYHLGRATTYCGLGALSAGLANGLEGLSGLKGLSAALLALAASILAIASLRRLGVLAQTSPGGWAAWMGRWAKPLFEHPIGWRGYGLGVMLGFIPCGLLYGALAAAAATAEPLAGALAMLAFVLGTAPVLLVVGLIGHLAGSRIEQVPKALVPGLMLANAVVLAYLAWRAIEGI